MGILTNVVEMFTFQVYSDLDDFELTIEVFNREDLNKAMEISQKTFDEWHDSDATETLQDCITGKLSENDINYSIYEKNDSEYIIDLEEECENLSEENRILKQQLKLIDACDESSATKCFETINQIKRKE